MIIDLEKREVQDLLSLVKTSSFRGDSAEKVVMLKTKLQLALEEDIGKRDTSNVCS
jgi:hypothetical protein